MSRRRPRRKSGNSSVQAVQIVGLIVILVVILLFRDNFSASTSALMDALGTPASEDVTVGTDVPPVQTPDAGVVPE